jgi:cyclohexanone monooxygenase
MRKSGKRREKPSQASLYDYNDTTALSVSEEQRRKDYEARWQKGGVNFVRTYCDLALNEKANDTAANFVRSKIEEIVRDPQTAAKLKPHDHPIGTKRICVDTDYFATYNRDNVTLVDIRSAPIEAMTETGLKTTDETYELDCLVFATGFDAVTGALAQIDIRAGKDSVLPKNGRRAPAAISG